MRRRRQTPTRHHQTTPLETPRQSGLNQPANRAGNSILPEPKKSQIIRRRTPSAHVVHFVRRGRDAVRLSPNLNHRQRRQSCTMPGLSGGSRDLKCSRGEDFLSLTGERQREISVVSGRRWRGAFLRMYSHSARHDEAIRSTLRRT